MESDLGTALNDDDAVPTNMLEVVPSAIPHVDSDTVSDELGMQEPPPALSVMFRRIGCGDLACYDWPCMRCRKADSHTDAEGADHGEGADDAPLDAEDLGRGDADLTPALVSWKQSLINEYEAKEKKLVAELRSEGEEDQDFDAANSGVAGPDVIDPVATAKILVGPSF